jgi:hypothetical protein
MKFQESGELGFRQRQRGQPLAWSLNLLLRNSYES